jgi:hypothetical protein
MNNSIINNESINTDLELDFTWLQEFEKLDNEYKNYYTEELSFIRIHSIYVNSDNEITKIKEQKMMLKTPSTIYKEELFDIIKHNSFFCNIKYSLLSILKFNLNIEPINLTNFLKNKDKNIGNSFLQPNKHIDTIKFDKSISMFHDINDIIIIFHHKITSHIPSNRTKKIFINSNAKKKTKKKELKETTPI